MQQGVKIDAACPSKNLGVVSRNTALKQQRRWLLKSIPKRQLKSVFAQVQTSSRLFHLVQFVKFWRICLELDSTGVYQSSGKAKEGSLSCVQVLHKT